MTAFTSQQLRAIIEPGNLLVAAAAGSGKTAVLTERIAFKVIEGTPIDRILVVTFTNAAAAEMRKRIAARLEQAAGEARSPEEQARLRRQAARTGSASISTIHGFCLHVLRRHFQEAGLDPAFRMGDETETALLLEDALQQVLEERYEQGDPGFLQLLDHLGGEEALVEAVQALYASMRAQPDPPAWLREACGRYHATAGQLADSPAVAELLQGAKAEIQTYLNALLREADALGDAPLAAGALQEDAAAARALLLARDYDEYRERLEGITFSRMTFPRSFTDRDKAPAKRLREEYKKLIYAQRDKRFFHSLAEEEALLQLLAPGVDALCLLMEDLEEAYSAAKARESLVDFSDLEHKALGVLREERIAREYEERYQWIFVDEYQDTNRVQEAIITRLCSGENLFLVGDVKQSIYRFRLADPGLFLEKYSRFGQGLGGCRVDLNSNFRSARRVIDGVNAVFSQIMSHRLGELEYDQSARLVMGRDGGEGGMELHLVCTEEALEREEEDAEDPAALENAQLAALVIARRIRELMAGAAREEGADYRYADFAILLRSTRSQALAYTQMLALEGVPAYAELTGGYFDAVEVAVFLNLLRLLDNRRQDIPLVSVLRSPMGGFCAQELLELRQGHPEGSFWDALVGAAEQAGRLGQKAGAFLARLERYRRDAMLYRLEALISHLLEDTGYYLFVGALPGGPARQANLDELMRRAHAYEQGRGRTLCGFLRFMDRARSNDSYGVAQTAGRDVVRVLSIHKSKGLEFPVVFVAGLERRFNLTDRSRPFLPDASLGLGLRVRLGRRKVSTLYHHAAAQKALRETKSEEMRLLYVAMTRARERLILIGAVRDPEEYILSHDMPADPVLLTREQNYLGWLTTALLNTPEGNPLREYAGLPLRGGQGSFDVTVHRRLGRTGQGAAMAPEQYGEWAEQAAKKEPSPAFRDALRWEYPYQSATKIPSKQSVSDLAHEAAITLRTPRFLKGRQPLSATDRGSAAHLVLEQLPLAAHTPKSVASFTEGMVARGLLTREERDAVLPERIAGFFQSPLGRRLLRSPRVERELEFNYLMPARELRVGDAQEPVMVQGVIDCCFLEQGEWVLVDYKTDRVPPGVSPAAAAMKHREQLELYSRALSALSGVPVKEGHVYLLSIGESARVLP